MSNWQIVTPASTTNLIENPSFEVNVTDGWSSGGGMTVTQSADDSWRGVYSAKCVTAANNQWFFADITGLTASTTYAITLRVKVTVGGVHIHLYDSGGFNNGQSVYTLEGTTDWVEATAIRTTGVGITGIRIWTRDPTSGVDVCTYYIDAVQLEEASEATTYCDGDQEDCTWLGVPHNSISERSGGSRAGGLLDDIRDDYGLRVTDIIGAGMPRQSVIVDSYALLPGGALNTARDRTRDMRLVSTLIGTDASCDLDAARQALVELLHPRTYPVGGSGVQPTIWRYTGAEVDKEIAAHYRSGLEARLGVDNRIHETIPLRLVAANPMWYSLEDDAVELDLYNSATYRAVIARRDGVWDDMGPPNAAGTYTAVYSIVIGPDGLVYIGGDFLNFDNIAAGDYIIAYDPVAGTYSALAGGLNGIVYTMAFDADGTLFVGGAFTNAGGDANADYFAKWNGTAFSAVGIPLAGAAAINNVRDIVISPTNGYIYIVGDFTNWANVAAADYIAYWNTATSAWGSIAAAFRTQALYALAAAPNGDIYFSGEVDTGVAGDDASVYKFDADYTATVTTLGGLEMAAPSSAFCLALAFRDDGLLFIGGDFDGVEGVTASKVCIYNGTAFSAMGDGLGARPTALAIAPDWTVWAVGYFVSPGGKRMRNIARWNGSTWAPAQCAPTCTAGEAIAIGFAGPVLRHDYDIFTGFLPGGGTTFEYAGLTTATNDGTARAYPIIEITCTGKGTWTEIQSIRNETTGDELQFDHYAMVTNEKLTIDLRPGKKSIVSSVYGPRSDALLTGSDFGAFSLAPGANEINCAVETTGGGTFTGTMRWRPTYRSFD